jgi:hypothetical protein
VLLAFGLCCAVWWWEGGLISVLVIDGTELALAVVVQQMMQSLS